MDISGLNFGYLRGDIEKRVVLTRAAFRAFERLLIETHEAAHRYIDTRTMPAGARALCLCDMVFTEGWR